MTVEERIQLELKKLKAIRNCEFEVENRMTTVFRWNIDCQIELLTKILLGEE